MKMLIVDDERDILDLFMDIFTKEQYDVQCASNGKAALEEIAKRKPDVVLLDIKMPDMDGLETLEVIKTKDSSIEVVMLTAFGYDDKLIDDAMKKGASGFISKNLPLQQIISTFKTLLKSMHIKED